MNDIYIVTYCDSGKAPVVTAFNNIDSANRCYEYFKLKHEFCCIDTCPVYENFVVDTDKNFIIYGDNNG